MNSDKLQMIQNEVHDERTPAKRPQETFAFKLFRMGMRLAKLWLAFAVGVLGCQVWLLATMENPVFIPGIVPLLWVSGGVSIALIGGEEGVDIAKKLKDGQSNSVNGVGR